MSNSYKAMDYGGATWVQLLRLSLTHSQNLAGREHYKASE